MEQIVSGTYKHYKGGKYEVICVAKQEADGQWVAVYRSLSSGEIFTRPKTEFYGMVSNGVRRFEKVEVK